VGNYNKVGYKKVSLECSGGSSVYTPRIAVDKAIRPLVSPPTGFKLGEEYCGGVHNVSDEAYECLIRVCYGSFVHFKDIRIVGLKAPEYIATVCVEGGTHVRITNALFQDNQASFVGTSWGTVSTTATSRCRVCRPGLVAAVLPKGTVPGDQPAAATLSQRQHYRQSWMRVAHTVNYTCAGQLAAERKHTEVLCLAGPRV
jgi:hypothetical protein